MTTWDDIKDNKNFIKVLDHGFVGLTDHMGNDKDIADAARTSYGQGTKTVRDDEKLIRYLVKHNHSSPLEMGELKFLIKIPLFVARQLFRHRTSNVNEMSARYSIMPNEIYIPDLDVIQPQSKDNKQGRAGTFTNTQKEKIRNDIIEHSNESYKFYEQLINENLSGEVYYNDGNNVFTGIARELARTVLPTGIYTQLVWKQDLKNLLHLIRLRLDSHAQYEIRVMAQAMYDLVYPLFPATCDAFDDYVRNSITLSKMEKEFIHYLLNDNHVRRKWHNFIDTNGGIDKMMETHNMSKREFNDFIKQWKLNH